MMSHAARCGWFILAALAWFGAGHASDNGSVLAESSSNAPPRRLRIAPYRATIAGIGDPRQPVTVTVRGPDGTIRGSRVAVADAEGAFRVDWFVDARRMRIGDSVEAELQRADPIAVVIPRVTAAVEPDTDRVFGEAPAGATVTVSPAGAAAPAIVVMPDAGGRYVARFANLFDLDAPSAGAADVTLPAGHVVALDWAAVTLSVDLSLSTVAGAGPRGRDVRVELREGALEGGGVGGDGRVGTVVAAGRDAVPRVGPPGSPHAAEWIVPFRDAFGQQVDIAPGDTISVTVGDDRAMLAAPVLDGAVSVSGDHVDVRTSPGRTVRVRAARAGGAAPTMPGAAITTTVTAGSDGWARASFAGTFDVRFGDRITLQTFEGRHAFARHLRPAGLSLNLDDARLEGAARRPGDRVKVTLDQGGRETLRTVRSDAAGRFQVQWLRSGRPIALQAGDRITVADPSGRVEAMTLLVPELTVAGEAETDRAGGRATPGGALRVTVGDIRGIPDVFHPTLGSTALQRMPAEIAPDGAWTADFRDRFDVRAGTLLQADYQTPEGHDVRRSRALPWLNVQHGGAAVCGHAEPRAIVTARLSDAAGRRKASSIARAAADGGFQLILADSLRRPVAAEHGDTVVVEAPSTRMALTLPALAAAADWAGGVVAGRAPAGAALAVRRPAGLCGGAARASAEWLSSDPDGAFRVSLASTTPGDGLEITLFTAEGYRVFRPFVRPRARAHVGRARIDGRAAPLEPVRAVVTRGGRVIATTETLSGLDGGFAATAQTGSGEPAVLRPGDRVEVVASAAAESVVIEPLSLDWSPEDGVTMLAASEARATLELWAEDHLLSALDIAADAAGAYRLTPGDVPARSAWTLADVSGVRATIDVAGGHALVAEAGAPGGAGADGAGAGRAVLPWVGAGGLSLSPDPPGAQASARRVLPLSH